MIDDLFRNNLNYLMRNDGSSLEEHVRFVYDTLLGLKGEQIVVTRGATLLGKSGAKYKVDVFYEFVQAGIRHRVVIECKDRKHPIERDEVLAFDAKVKDIAQVVGVIVSSSGYQAGAREYGEHERIILLTAGELPTIGMLLASRIEASTMPDESCIGEPFWTLFETHKDGRLTGSPFAINVEGTLRIPLFISKGNAEAFCKMFGDLNNFVVRGVPQRVLRGLCIQARRRGAFALMYGVPINPSDPWPSKELSVDDVKREFLAKQWRDF